MANAHNYESLKVYKRKDKNLYSRTGTFFGSYFSTISFILSIFVCATLERSVMPWSCEVSSLKISSANSTREASCRNALLRVQFVTAWSSSSVTLGFPFSSRKLVRERYFGSTTRCTKGISNCPKSPRTTYSPIPAMRIKRNSDIHSTHQHKKRQVTATLN